MFCKSNEHFKNFYYCENCAREGKQAHKVFFCERCHRAIRLQHLAHKDELKQIEHDKFKGPFEQLKSIINQQLVKTKQKFDKNKQTPNKFSQTMKKLKTTKAPYLRIIDEKEKFIDIIRNEEIMRWLLSSKFWQCSVQNASFMKFQGRFSNQLQQQMISMDQSLQKVVRPVVVTHIPEKFNLEWGQTDNDTIISEKIQQLREQTMKRTKQQDIYNVVIKMFQSYKMQDCFNVDDECVRLIQKYPDSKVLYLCRIRMNQLLPEGNKQIKKILNDIVKNVDKKFDSTDFYHYYLAMAQWQIIEDLGNKKELVFFELKNKKYYHLVQVDVYIDELNKAIGIREKPVYYISLGLGYMVKGNYHEALRVFKKASNMLGKHSDSLDANMFWTQVHNNPHYNDFQALIQNLQTRTLQFIVSICKHFKKSKHYSQLVQCCQQLILRQPTNKNFKIQFIKSILSYTSTLKLIEGKDDEKIGRAERMIIELKNAQENSAAGELDKKLKRLRAKYEFKHGQYYNASEGYQILARGTKFTTASDYYNHAGSLFKLFIQDQCSDDDLLKRSYQMILKALNLKPDNCKYKKLKFFICTYMNKFNQANQVYEQLKTINPKLINERQYERLVEYIKDNQEY